MVGQVPQLGEGEPRRLVDQVDLRLLSGDQVHRVTAQPGDRLGDQHRLLGAELPGRPCLPGGVPPCRPRRGRGRRSPPPHPAGQAVRRELSQAVGEDAPANRASSRSNADPTSRANNSSTPALTARVALIRSVKASSVNDHTGVSTTDANAAATESGSRRTAPPTRCHHHRRTAQPSLSPYQKTRTPPPPNSSSSPVDAPEDRHAAHFATTLSSRHRRQRPGLATTHSPVRPSIRFDHNVVRAYSRGR